MQALSVFPVKAYSDNYIWCIHNNRSCVVVDPGDAEPVLSFLQENNLKLTDILITHHHWDHTNGIDDLLTAFPETLVHGPDNPTISQIQHTLKEGDTPKLKGLEIEFSVLEVPGHTLDHIAYYHDVGLFCGDTLFSVGCGRLFEGTPKQMLNSLKKLAKLPAHTKIFCTHEYTLANVAFAKAVEPDNEALAMYEKFAQAQRNKGRPTLPSTIGLQCSINPFLRSDSPQVIEQASIFAKNQLTTELDVFTHVRTWKDNF